MKKIALSCRGVIGFPRVFRFCGTCLFRVYCISVRGANSDRQGRNNRNKWCCYDLPEKLLTSKTDLRCMCLVMN